MNVGEVIRYAKLIEKKLELMQLLLNRVISKNFKGHVMAYNRSPALITLTAGTAAATGALYWRNRKRPKKKKPTEKAA